MGGWKKEGGLQYHYLLFSPGLRNSWFFFLGNSEVLFRFCFCFLLIFESFLEKWNLLWIYTLEEGAYGSLTSALKGFIMLNFNLKKNRTRLKTRKLWNFFWIHCVCTHCIHFSEFRFFLLCFSLTLPRTTQEEFIFPSSFPFPPYKQNKKCFLSHPNSNEDESPESSLLFPHNLTKIQWKMFCCWVNSIFFSFFFA